MLVCATAVYLWQAVWVCGCLLWMVIWSKPRRNNNVIMGCQLGGGVGWVGKSKWLISILIHTSLEYLDSLSGCEWVSVDIFSVDAAVAVNDKLTYAVVEVHPNAATGDEASESAKSGKGKKRIGSALADPKVRYLVVAADLVKTLESKWGVKLEIKGTFPGSALELSRWLHFLCVVLQRSISSWCCCVFKYSHIISERIIPEM